MRVLIKNNTNKSVSIFRVTIPPNGSTALDVPTAFVEALKGYPEISVSTLDTETIYSRERLEELYFEKFGKKPRSNMKDETLRKRLGV